MNESAIQADGLKSLKQIFQQIGGWPTLLGNNWRENVFNWKDALRKLRRIGINVDFFLIHSIQKDNVDPERYVLNVSRFYCVETKCFKIFSFLSLKILLMDLLQSVTIKRNRIYNT